MYKGVFLIHYVFHKRFSDTVLIRDETYVTNHRHIIERILRYGVGILTYLSITALFKL